MTALLIALLLGCPAMPAGRDDDDAVDDDDSSDDDDDDSSDDDDGSDDDDLGLVVWATHLEDVLTQDQTPDPVDNGLWADGSVELFAARGETVSFVLVLSAAEEVGPLSIDLPSLSGPTTIATTNPDPASFADRPIELFYVRYLPIEGLSRLSYETYDERHIPERMRRPFTGEGYGEGVWEDRPDHERMYPEIAVPLEYHPGFTAAPQELTQIVVDVHVPAEAPPGLYAGGIELRIEDRVRTVPVRLDVRPVTLPAVPSLSAMAYVGYADINARYLGEPWIYDTAQIERSLAVRDRFYQLLRRHRIDGIGDSGSDLWAEDRPRDEWTRRLTGELFTPAHGYSGPGQGQPMQTYAIGVYGSWGWADEGEAGMHSHLDGWAEWFADNAPTCEPFLYLIDESTDYAQTEQWAAWAASNPGPGAAIPTMATVSLPNAAASIPSLDQPASWVTVGVPDAWEAAAEGYRSGAGFFLYNGHRPATGSFATEDDGVALRVTAWTQHKHRVKRWFYWETTYWDNFQAGAGPTDVFTTAHTFGANAGYDAILGQTGWNYSNGDGVLFYPGTDLLFPDSSYGVDVPFVSLRMKRWRRGLQDGDYLALAAAADAEATAAVVEAMIPTTLWEHGVSDASDPTWVRAAPSWSTSAEDWDNARRALLALIEGG